MDIRELVISNPKFTNQNAFNSYIKKTLTGLKEAPEEITVEVATSGITGSFYGWIDNYALGQKVQIKQPEWGITDTKYRILRADIGPLVTRLELSTRKKHLETLRSDLAGKIDVSNVWPAGAALQEDDWGHV